jgi:hypothetical protein
MQQHMMMRRMSKMQAMPLLVSKMKNKQSLISKMMDTIVIEYHDCEDGEPEKNDVECDTHVDTASDEDTDGDFASEEDDLGHLEEDMLHKSPDNITPHSPDTNIVDIKVSIDDAADAKNEIRNATFPST